jgi:hypothetical protein
MQMLNLFLVISTVAAESTPGTETILLVRGGYGPGVNLISSGAETHRHLKNNAPVDRTPSEKNELAKLNNVSMTAMSLNSQLQTAIKSTYAALQESEQVRVDDANLKEKLSADERKIKQGADAEKARAELEAEVKSLQAQLEAEKAKTAQEHARGEAIRVKADSLEHDIALVTRSWKAAAQHQANLRKAAEAELKASEAKSAAVAVKAKKAPVTVTKAQVQKKSVKKAVKKVAKKVVVEVKEDDEDSDNDDDSDSDDDDDDSDN